MMPPISYASHLLVAVLSALAALALSRRWRIFRMQRRFRRGRRGEREAAELLERRGYVILDAQLTRRVPMWIDDERVEFDVRADYLVAKAGRTYVVEVKTGSRAPDPKGAATRRQLLEYGRVYGADGLLLADMRDGVLRRVRFGRAGSHGRGGWGWGALIVMALAGAYLGAVAGARLGAEAEATGESVVERLRARLSPPTE